LVFTTQNIWKLNLGVLNALPPQTRIQHFISFLSKNNIVKKKKKKGKKIGRRMARFSSLTSNVLHDETPNSSIKSIAIRPNVFSEMNASFSKQPGYSDMTNY
jgi:hypothetical protein